MISSECHNLLFVWLYKIKNSADCSLLSLKGLVRRKWCSFLTTFNCYSVACNHFALTLSSLRSSFVSLLCGPTPWFLKIKLFSNTFLFPVSIYLLV